MICRLLAFQAAMSALDGEISPLEEDVATPADFRKHLTKALLYKVTLSFNCFKFL